MVKELRTGNWDRLFEEKDDGDKETEVEKKRMGQFAEGNERDTSLGLIRQ